MAVVGLTGAVAMLNEWRVRRKIRWHAAEWAAEAIELYGTQAEETLRACLRHPGYQGSDRLCLEQVLGEVLRLREEGAAGQAVIYNPTGFVFGWLGTLGWQRSRAPRARLGKSRPIWLRPPQGRMIAADAAQDASLHEAARA